MGLLSYINKLVKETGYVYVPVGEDVRFDRAIRGTIIENDSFAPPWIIVDKTFEKIILTKWPGKLFEVEILNPAKEEHINVDISKDAQYLRTTGIKILNELPTDLLFGKYGSEVVTILNTIKKITKENVENISGLLSQNAREIYSTVWSSWINDNTHTSNTNYDTLKIVSEIHQRSSPINEGLSLIKSTFDKRAVEVLGKYTWVFDKNGNPSLNNTWQKASEVFLHAAMSFESYDLLSKEEKEILRKPYNTLTQL